MNKYFVILFHNELSFCKCNQKLKMSADCLYHLLAWHDIACLTPVLCSSSYWAWGIVLCCTLLPCSWRTHALCHRSRQDSHSRSVPYLLWDFLFLSVNGLQQFCSVKTPFHIRNSMCKLKSAFCFLCS